MDATHLHLMLTHFPIVGTVIAIAILAYGLFSSNDQIKKVALFTFIAMAILTIPVFLTGEDAEETVEHIAGVSEQIIEQHEELAEKAIWLMGLLAAFSVASLFAIIKKLSSAKVLSIITLVISLVTFAVFAKVGNLGGQIRHSEIRTSTSQLNDTSNLDKKSNDKEEDGDDD